MLESVWVGTAGVLFGGALTASFALPMKLARRWSWESVWLAYSAVALIAIPVIVVSVSVPDAARVYAMVPAGTLLMTSFFGFAWGVANVLFGLAVPIVGMALSFSIVVGMSAALGSLIPLVLLHPDRVWTAAGMFIIAGVVLTLTGVAILGAAGRKRELARHQARNAGAGDGRSVALGLLLCIASGLLAPMLNFSFAFGSEISQQASARGATPLAAVNAIWLVALAGGFLSNGGYSLIRLTRNRTWSDYVAPGTGTQWSLTAAMGILWTGGLLLYGWGGNALGSLGTAVGWPVYQGAMILTSTLLGAFTGEWKGASAAFVRNNCLGLAVLITAIVVLSIGNRV
ncbi:MAG: L-rhamnose/proton symporter RhaT [Bryobacteraceae bacterium]